MKVFVLVPSLTNSGAVKGAIALCQGLRPHLPVTLVSLKRPKGKAMSPPASVPLLDLSTYGTWRQKYRAYRAFLASNGTEPVISLSFCFSADCFNSFFAPYATVVSSVRGNLPRNYFFDYGMPGWGFAIAHLLLLRRFAKVVTISTTMARQLARLGISTVTIGNFLDEVELESFREHRGAAPGPFRFVSVGTLTSRKRPDLLIDAIHTLKQRSGSCQIDLVGDGPLASSLRARVHRLGLSPEVLFHGHLDQPYTVLQRADCFVLPSESEGVPRAAMEALYFGIPCILRAVDANAELIQEGDNGLLFGAGRTLPDAMAAMMAARRNRRHESRDCLLPAPFRQEPNIRKLLDALVGTEAWTPASISGT